MGKLFRFLGGAVIGAAVGTGAAILLAPQSGRQLQDSLRRRREGAEMAARTSAENRERELKAAWQARINAEGIKREALR